MKKILSALVLGSAILTIPVAATAVTNCGAQRTLAGDWVLAEPGDDDLAFCTVTIQPNGNFSGNCRNMDINNVTGRLNMSADCGLRGNAENRQLRLEGRTWSSTSRRPDLMTLLVRGNRTVSMLHGYRVP